jgi:hypothetical protein
MTSPWGRRLGAVTSLLAGLAGLPLLLLAMVGPPGAPGLWWWQWAAGLRYQSLPVESVLAALAQLTWGLWAYAALVTVLRVVAVVAARRGIGGSARLLAFTNLVTVGPERSLVDAAVGVSLLASATMRLPPPPPLPIPRPWCAPWMRRPVGSAPTLGQAPFRPTPSWSRRPRWLGPILGHRRPLILPAQPTPAMLGCTWWQRGIRCGGSLNGSWGMPPLAGDLRR